MWLILFRFNIIHDNHHSWSLQIKDVQAEDRGYYMCQVRTGGYFMCQVRTGATTCVRWGQGLLQVRTGATTGEDRGYYMCQVRTGVTTGEDRGYYRWEQGPLQVRTGATSCAMCICFLHTVHSACAGEHWPHDLCDRSPGRRGSAQHSRRRELGQRGTGHTQSINFYKINQLKWSYTIWTKYGQ